MAEMAVPAGVGDKKLYARKSSGLVRTIGIFGAMVFGVHCISLSSSGLIPFSWVAGVWPGQQHHRCADGRHVLLPVPCLHLCRHRRNDASLGG